MSTTTRHGLVKPGYGDFADIAVINGNMDKIEEVFDTKADASAIVTPFNFKGSCLYAALPGSGNTQNDTYYVTDKFCHYTWNGSAWKQSSLDESAYQTQLSALQARMDALQLYVDSDGDICQGEEESES